MSENEMSHESEIDSNQIRTEEAKKSVRPEIEALRTALQKSKFSEEEGDLGDIKEAIEKQAESQLD